MAFTALAIGAVAAPIVGGIVGNVMASGDRKRAAAAAAQAYQEALALGLPPDNAREIVYKEFQKYGDLTPELEQNISAGISQVSQIQEDPGLRNAQTQALQLLQQRGRGLNAEDRAALNQVRSEMAQDSEAKRQQIIQNFQQRGMGGSGAEIMAQLQQAQAGANQSSAEGDRIAAQASANALTSIGQAGQLGGQIRSQDFSNAQAKASAADEFKRFDVANQLTTQQQNVAAKNAAQQYNLDNSQRVQDLNTQQANNEQLRQRAAEEQYWQDMAQRTQIRANAAAGQASNFQNSANATAQQYAGIGAGVGAASGALAASSKLGVAKAPTDSTGVTILKKDPNALYTS